MKSYCLNIPENLNIDEISKKFLISTKLTDSTEKVDKVRRSFILFFNWLYFAQFRSHVYAHNDSVGLNSRHLKSLLGEDYCSLIHFLCDVEIIDKGKSYKKGVFPKQFKLLHPYDTGARLVDNPEDKEWCCKKLNKVSLAIGKDDKGGSSELTIALENYLLDINLNDGVDAARTSYEFRKKGDGEEPDVQYFLRSVSVLRFKKMHPAWFCKRPKFARLYSAATNCPRELRTCFTYQGKKVIECDQRASQPFLLLELYTQVKTEESKAEALKYYDLWNRERNDGDFYRNLVPNKARAEIKKAIIEGVLNCKENPQRQSPEMKVLSTSIEDVYQREFPILWDEIHRLKTLKMPELGVDDPKDRHKQYARYMQGLESSIFLDGIAKECVEKKIWIYTVHDCIGCLEEDLETVQKIATGHLRKKCGFDPVWKVG